MMWITDRSEASALHPNEKKMLLTKLNSLCEEGLRTNISLLRLFRVRQQARKIVTQLSENCPEAKAIQFPRR